MVQNLNWATAHLSRRLGAGLGAWHSDTADTHAGRGRRAGHDRMGGLGAAWACSWARLGVLVHLTQFLAWFDSVFS